MRLIAYIMRHGSTPISPNPEGWKPIGLSETGQGEARAGADFLSQFIREGGPRPDWGISSDLPRAEQTLAIAAGFLGIPVVQPMASLRAFEENEESPAEYEDRTIQGFNSVLQTAVQTNSVPLIVCHRSSTGFLGKRYESWMQHPDYRFDALLLEGGVLGITDCGIIPLFRAVDDNWPPHMRCNA